MSANDQENRKPFIHDTDGATNTWVLAVIAILIVVGGIFLYSGDDEGIEVTPEPAPTAIEEITPTETLPAE